MNPRLFCLAVALMLTALGSTCRTLAQEQVKDSGVSSLKYEKEGEWKPLFSGVDGLNLNVSAPRRMKAFAVRIALDTPGIEFVSTPDNGDRPDEVDGIYTSTFLKQQKCQIAINAGAFAPVTDLEGAEKNIQGLHISEGKLVSPWQNGYDAVVIGKANRAAILKAEPKDLSELRTAVSGFQVNLWKGEIVKGDATIHPRTVLGISKDAKIMYWLVIDGRQPTYSEGAKTSEAAQLLKDLGAENGINLDGGGTSTLVLENADGAAKVINRPIHRGIPGLERPGASHLGVRAEKLKR